MGEGKGSEEERRFFNFFFEAKYFYQDILVDIYLRQKPGLLEFQQKDQKGKQQLKVRGGGKEKKIGQEIDGSLGKK